MEHLKEMITLAVQEVAKYNIPTSDLDGATAAIVDFINDNPDTEQLNHSILYVLLISAAYKAGRESVGEV